jgi:hypothetical protein
LKRAFGRVVESLSRIPPPLRPPLLAVVALLALLFLFQVVALRERLVFERGRERAALFLYRGETLEPYAIRVSSRDPDTILDALLERRSNGPWTTFVPEGLRGQARLVDDGRLEVWLSAPLSRAALAQLLLTMSQVEGVRELYVSGQRYRPELYAEALQDPTLLSPVDGQSVAGPVVVEALSRRPLEYEVTLLMRDEERTISSGRLLPSGKPLAGWRRYRIAVPVEPSLNAAAEARIFQRDEAGLRLGERRATFTLRTPRS